MRIFVLASLCLCFFAADESQAGVRHISAKKDQIIPVKTALGIATIVQVPDRPTSVVIGDQASFKVEYLDKAITIKPLVAGARTNLHVYTDWQRYNIKLIPTSKVSAYYVIYIKPRVVKKKPEKIKLHAVLCRNFLMGETTYIKGRDYFDLDWYLTNGIKPNYTLLKNALFKAGPFENQELQIDNTWLKNELENKLKVLDWDLAKSDMSNFLLEGSLEDLDTIFNSDSMIKKTESL